MKDIYIDELRNKDEVTARRCKQLIEKYKKNLQIMLIKLVNEMLSSSNLMKMKMSVKNEFLPFPSGFFIAYCIHR